MNRGISRRDALRLGALAATAPAAMSVAPVAANAGLNAAAPRLTAQAEPPPPPDHLGLPRDGESRLYLPDEAYPRFPMPPGSEAYAHLDGLQMKEVMREIIGFSRVMRDDGNQYWGRIAGTPYERLTLDWVLEQFNAIGLQDVHEQGLDVNPPLWYPNSWQAYFTVGRPCPPGSGRPVPPCDDAVPLVTTFPIHGTMGTPPSGLTGEAVWVGLGEAADFRGRNVRGKAVFIHSIMTPGGRNHTAARGPIDQANEAGAAMVFVIMGMPGNAHFQPMGAGDTVVPTFSVSPDEGHYIRDLLGDGQRVYVQLTADIERLEGLRTANIWGTLPGATDEEILLMAHTDGVFDGALDNASGMAMLLEIAKHYADIPQQQRPRTLTFLTTPDHHDGTTGVSWVRDNYDFSNTMLIVNCEHPSQTVLYLYRDGLITSTAVSPRRWFVGGSDELKELFTTTLRDFGVTLYAEPEGRPGGELSRLWEQAPSFHIIDHVIYHSTLDVAELVPAWQLENATAAFMKVIDTVNEWEAERLRGA